MQSMTGFGHAERHTSRFQILVDLRTVNSRYFDFKSRLPRELIELENGLRSLIQQRLQRGRIDLHLELRPLAGAAAGLNEEVALRYLQAADRLRELGLQGALAVADMLALPGVVLAPGEVGELDEEVRGSVEDAVREAVAGAWESRRQEGAALKAELDRRRACLAGLVERIAAGAGSVRDHYRRKLEAALEEWGLRASVDENRLLQELVLYVEKSDISEEIARLRSHLVKFESLLDADGAVGRDLDFLCQEMNREVNTILAKSVLVDVTEAAVEAKVEIERIREQVQNVE
ncbi:MAG: YicC family protein [Acidobacteriota bacterium]